jgi:hypothetical protein
VLTEIRNRKKDNKTVDSSISSRAKTKSDQQSEDHCHPDNLVDSLSHLYKITNKSRYRLKSTKLAGMILSKRLVQSGEAWQTSSQNVVSASIEVVSSKSMRSSSTKLAGKTEIQANTVIKSQAGSNNNIDQSDTKVAIKNRAQDRVNAIRDTTFHERAHVM